MHLSIKKYYFLAFVSLVTCFPHTLFPVSNLYASTNGNKLKTLITKEFVKHDVNYSNNKIRYGKRLSTLGGILNNAERNGMRLYCSQQIFLEAKWLHRYTAYWDELDDKLNKLERSLENKSQEFANQQSSIDGAWGPCYERDFLRIGATIDEITVLHDEGRKPVYPVKDISIFSTPNALKEYLNSLLVSKIHETGIDNRGELSNLITSLTQSINKEHFKRFFRTFLEQESEEISQKYENVILEFIKNIQNSDDGYWGARYIIDDKVHQSADLSMTYHVIAYSKGAIENWNKVINTTFDIENQPYPYGWRHNGEYNNHNLYDVAKIFRYGWNHMNPEQKTIVTKKIETLIQWSLSNTLDEHGKFKLNTGFSDSIADEYYFGVSFLDVVGYWSAKKRFWLESNKGDDNLKFCCLISRHLQTFPQGGWALNGAKEKLNRNCTCN